MELGDRIQRAWRSFVHQNVDGKGLREALRGIEWDEAHPIERYFYVVIGGSRDEPEIQRFEGPMMPDYFQGASSSKLVAAIGVHGGMTKKDLLDFDVAEETNFWDHPDWSDG